MDRPVHLSGIPNALRITGKRHLQRERAPSCRISLGTVRWSTQRSPPARPVSLLDIDKERPRILSVDTSYLGLGVVTVKKSHVFHHKFIRSH